MEVQQEAIRTGWCGAELVADSQVTAATGAFSLKFEFSGSVQCFPSCGSGRSSRSMWGAITRLLWEKKTKLWDTNLLQKSRIIWPLWSSNSYYKGAVLCWVFVVFLNVISYFPSQIFRLTVTHRIHPHRSSQSDSSLSRLVHYRGWMMTSSVCVCVCVCVCVSRLAALGCRLTSGQCSLCSAEDEHTHVLVFLSVWGHRTISFNSQTHSLKQLSKWWNKYYKISGTLKWEHETFPLRCSSLKWKQ